MRKDSIQIRFADIDVFNHVNNINVQHYYDLGKMNYYRETLGLDVITQNPALVIVSSTTNYFNPILMGSQIEVHTSIEQIGSKSLMFYQQIIDIDSKEIKSDCRATMVGFDRELNCSIELLTQWVEAICRHEGLSETELRKPKQ